MKKALRVLFAVAGILAAAAICSGGLGGGGGFSTGRAHYADRAGYADTAGWAVVGIDTINLADTSYASFHAEEAESAGKTADGSVGWASLSPAAQDSITNVSTGAVGWLDLIEAVRDSITNVSAGVIDWAALAAAVQDSIQAARVDSIVWSQLASAVQESIWAAHIDSILWGDLAQAVKDSIQAPPDSVGVSGWSTTSGLATHATEADHSDSTEIALTAYLAYTADALTNGLEWSLFTQTLLDSIFAHQPAFPDSVAQAGSAAYADTAQDAGTASHLVAEGLDWEDWATPALDSLQAFIISVLPDSMSVTHHADEADSAGVSEFSYQLQYAGYDSIPGGGVSVLVSTAGVAAGATYANTIFAITPVNIFAKGTLTVDSLWTGGFRVTDRTPLGASIAGRVHFSWTITKHSAGGM
jgi:hypothetical protein